MLNYLSCLLEPYDNLREILQNVAKLQGVSNMRKLGHLNNFTKVSNSILYSCHHLKFVFPYCTYYMLFNHQ